MSLRLKLMYRAATIYWQVFKPLTLGVKALLILDKKVLLVKHSYQDGWFLPGGGVKRRETLETAIRRECREEIGATLANLQLFGTYSSINEKKNDHVVVMLSTNFDYKGPNDREIVEAKLFDLNQLPDNISPGTKNRLNEYLSNNQAPFIGDW
ncbi:MAG: NUDIX domain-containing protein [Chloroflexota bacterium]